MSEKEFIILKKKCLDAFKDETAYCTASYIAQKIGESEADVFDALSELEDDDEVALLYAPCFFKHRQGIENPEFEQIKDTRHCINRTDYEFWADF